MKKTILIMMSVGLLPNLFTTPSFAQDATQGTVAVPVEAVTQEVVPKKWGVLLDTWNEFGAKSVNDLANREEGAEAKADAYTLIRPSYKLNDETSVALGLEANHGWGYESEENAKFSLSDPYLMIANSNLGSMGAIKTMGYARLYLPVSQASQNKEQITMLRLNSSAALPVGRFKIAGTIEPRFYFQTQDTYEKPKAGVRRDQYEVTANEYFRNLTYLNLSGRIVGPVSFYSLHGLMSRWFYESDETALDLPGQRDFAYNETIIKLELTSNVGLGVGISSLRSTNKPLTLYNEEDSVYVVDLNASF